VPCGLILNELITNAYKYAPRNDRKVSIEVSMTVSSEGQFTISVQDTGPGLPEGYENTGSLGLTLVRLLVDQIDGTMNVDSSGDGTMVRISFPDPSLI
jgi:two-component sensor histidine kinase